MGRWAFYRAVAPRLLEQLIAEPRLVLGVLALGREPAGTESAALAEGLRDEAAVFRARMEALRSCFPAEVEREAWGLAILRGLGFSSSDLGPEVDIDKRWRWMHDLLESIRPSSGRSLGYAVAGGIAVGEDLGYGPLRYLLPAEVVVAAADLEALTPDAVAGGLVDAELDVSLSSYGCETLEVLRACYTAAAARGYGMFLRFG